MREAGTIICAIPGRCWEGKTLKSVRQETLRLYFAKLGEIESRLGNGVGLEEELGRVARLSERIEQVALGGASPGVGIVGFGKALMSEKFPALRVGVEYYDLLRALHFSSSGAGDDELGGGTVIAPRDVGAHVKAFAKAAAREGYGGYPAVRQRIWFLTHRVLPARCGVVEFPDVLSGPERAEGFAPEGALDGRSWFVRLWWKWTKRVPPVPDVPVAQRRGEVTGPVSPFPESRDWQSYGQGNRGDFMEERLRSQIVEGLERGVPVNVGSQRHNMLTKILQEFIHVAEGGGEVPVMYNDGVLAGSFPLRCVEVLPDGWAPTKEFHVSLVSMRHLPLDQYIDLNWYRNVEVPTSKGLAGADAHCYRVSVEQFGELVAANRGQRMRIHVYHSGYVPAVMGFYRAATEVMSAGGAGAGALQLVPKLQPKGEGEFIEGRPWPE